MSCGLATYLPNGGQVKCGRTSPSMYELRPKYSRFDKPVKSFLSPDMFRPQSTNLIRIFVESGKITPVTLKLNKLKTTFVSFLPNACHLYYSLAS